MTKDIIDNRKYGDPKTVGDLRKELEHLPDDMPVSVGVDFFLGPPFECSFERQVLANIVEVKTEMKNSSPTGYCLVLDSIVNCSITFD